MSDANCSCQPLSVAPTPNYNQCVVVQYMRAAPAFRPWEQARRGVQLERKFAVEGAQQPLDELNCFFLAAWRDLLS